MQTQQTKVLIIDDEQNQRSVFSVFLKSLGFHVLEASDGLAGYKIYEAEDLDLIITDLNMPNLNGIEVVERIVSKDPDFPVIVISGNDILSDAVEAMRKGAFDYLIKPIFDLSVIELAVTKALDIVKLRKENKKYQADLEKLVNDKTIELRRTNTRLTRELEAKTKLSEELHFTTEELKVHKTYLEDIVSSRTISLEQSLEDLKNTQNELIRSQKMASLGGLVAGIAHEINTPVGIGVTAATFLLDKNKKITEKFQANNLTKQDLKSYLSITDETSNLIFSNMKRAAQLIKNFKQVAVDQSDEQRRVINLNSYLEAIVISLRPEIKKCNTSVSILGDIDLELDTYPGALSQVMTNLILNSLKHGYNDAIVFKIKIEFRKDENDVIITYSDNGNGIEKNNIDKIFEPFFTTKRSQGGTGLGLHIVFNLISSRLKGSIKCSSELNRGTEFEITIPIGKLL